MFQWRIIKWMRHILQMGRGEKQRRLLVDMPEEKTRQGKQAYLGGYY
jgi:hypothetical protein